MEVPAMTIQLPEKLEVALKAHAEATGITPDLYLRNLVERDLGEAAEAESEGPFETGYGMWKKYGISISDEDIAENRADMFRGFGEELP
jgi:hypothetical protein